MPCPTYVIDAPGGGGKIPVMPNYLISYSDHKVVLRNYEGYITTYEEPLDVQPARQGHLHATARTRDRSRARRASTACSRASRCGSSRAASRRSHARGNIEAHRLQRSGEVGALRRRRDRGTARRAAAGPANGDVPSRRRHGRAAKPEYGPGEEPRPREGEPTASAHGELL